MSVNKIQGSLSELESLHAPPHRCNGYSSCSLQSPGAPSGRGLGLDIPLDLCVFLGFADRKPWASAP